MLTRYKLTAPTIAYILSRQVFIDMMSCIDTAIVAHQIWSSLLHSHVHDLQQYVGCDFLIFSPHAYVVLTAAPVGHCSALRWAGDAIYPIALPATTLMFFFRTRAVYANNIYVTAFSFVLWLSVLATCTSVVPAESAGNIGPTQYCLITGIKPYGAGSGITVLIHDTCVFFAISWRLMQNSYIGETYGWRAALQVFFSGKYLPTFSKTLLLHGQYYYL